MMSCTVAGQFLSRLHFVDCNTRFIMRNESSPERDGSCVQFQLMSFERFNSMVDIDIMFVVK